MIEAVLKKRKPLPPPPDIIHANLYDDSTGNRGSRFIFIGDVHGMRILGCPFFGIPTSIMRLHQRVNAGCLEELKGLLDHIGFCLARDKVVCVGDVVNKVRVHVHASTQALQKETKIFILY
jgi:hypothetical protein